MKSIKIGNDIPFEWTIKRNSEAETFTDKTVTVWIQHSLGKKYTPDALSVSGNVISGIFRGKVQELTGEYTLVLVENKDLVNMNTLDHVQFIKLVKHTADEGGTDCSNLTTETVTLSDEYTVPSNGVGISSVEQTTTSTEDAGDNVVTVTLTNGNQSTFKVKNGSKGSTGETGPQGEPGLTTAEHDALIEATNECVEATSAIAQKIEDCETATTQCQTATTEASNVDAELDTTNKIITITNRNGESKSVTIPEGGGGSGGKYMIVTMSNVTETSATTDKTSTEVANAMNEGTDVFYLDETNGYLFKANLSASAPDMSVVEFYLIENETSVTYMHNGNAITIQSNVMALESDLDNKVDKVTGKGLSTNDYTDADKAEVAKVASKADQSSLSETNSAVEQISQNLQGKMDTPDSKTIEGFGITDAYTKDEVDSAVNAKISEPTTEGTSGQALVTDGEGGRSWQTVAVDTDEIEEVSASALVELREYIDSLLNGITTKGKIIMSNDVVNNLTSLSSLKPLSAWQGHLMSDLITENEQITASAFCDMATKLKPTAIAPEYNSYTIYTEGQYTIYNGLLYKCTTTLTTPEFFDAEHWSLTSVMAEFSNN